MSPVDSLEAILLDVLTEHGGWLDTRTIGQIARQRGVRVAPGTLGRTLTRMSERKLCARRSKPGAHAYAVIEHFGPVAPR